MKIFLVLLLVSSQAYADIAILGVPCVVTCTAPSIRGVSTCSIVCTNTPWNISSVESPCSTALSALQAVAPWITTPTILRSMTLIDRQIYNTKGQGILIDNALKACP